MARKNSPDFSALWSHDGREAFLSSSPSSLMSRLHDPEVAAAAEKLDAKVAALAEQATGVTA